MSKHVHLFSACFMIMLVSSIVCLAQVPSTVALQGQLFQQNGSPLPDGQYMVSVALHDGMIGDPIEICDNCLVEFYQGVFQMVIGGADAQLPTMDRQYWVSLTVNGEELYPRMPIHSVPYALAAKTSEYTPGMIPIGGLVPYAGSDSTAGPHFLPADGRCLSSKAYPALYAVIGTRYGDGSSDAELGTDFNLPDTRDVFVKGARVENALTTFADPLESDRVRLDNNAKGSVMEQGVMSTHELVAVMPSIQFTFMIRVR